MIKKWAINCISDELHHPVISRIYRIYLATVVMANVVFAVMDNYFQTGESAKSLICAIQPLLFFLLFLDFILRIIGSSRHLDMESYDETLHYNTLNGYLFSYYGFIDLIGSVPFIL